MTQDIAALIDIQRTYPQDRDFASLKRIAQERLNLMVEILPPEPLPLPGPRPFFDVLDAALSREIALQVGRPFWVDTVGNSALIEIRVQLEDGKIMKVFARRGMAYASNSHIFLVWMVIASLVLIAIAILFLRNRSGRSRRLPPPPRTSARGRDVAGFRPRGASEVRQAALAFIEMRRRIERQIDQRTTMLAGVSHDLRTILTRFKLELALLPEGPETEALRRDVDEMGRHGRGLPVLCPRRRRRGAGANRHRYLPDGDRSRRRADRRADYGDLPRRAMVKVRPDAFRRCIANLVTNAARYADTIRHCRTSSTIAG